MPWIDPDFPKTATPSDLVGRVLGLNPGMMTGPGTNTYLVGGRDPILIDTGIGLPEYVPNLDGYLRERGWRQPSRVVLTHRHRDHIGGVAHLRERFGGLRVSKMIHRDAGLPDGIDDLRDGQDVHGDGVTLVPIYTPGHASDHLCYYLPEEKALFTGEEGLLLGQVVAQMIGGVAGRVDGHERDAVAVHVLTVAQVVDPVGQAGIAMDHLRDAQAAEALAQVRDAADVISVAVREHDAGGLAPAPLAQIAVEIGDVLGKTDARVDQDGISAADQIRVRPRPRHHAGVEAEHAADEITRCRGLRKVGIDPGHRAPQDTPRKRRLTSSSAASAADEPSYTIWPLFMT